MTPSFIEEYQLSDNTICDSLLKMYEDASAKGLAYRGKSGNGRVQEEVKKSMDFWLQDADKLASPAQINELYRWFDYREQLNDFIDLYLDKFKFNEFGGTFTSRMFPQIQHYKPGEGYYEWHIDGAQLTGCERAMVYMTYLNDVTEGGGTMFYHQDYTVKPVKGKTVIFPAAYTHVHKGEISQTQHKYIITGWLWWQ